MQCIPVPMLMHADACYEMSLVGEVSQLCLHPHAQKHTFMATRSCLKPSARLAALG